MKDNAHMSINQEVSLGRIYLEGGMAGVVNSFISGPTEHIRIRLQTQSHEESRRLYSGTSDCIRKIVGQAGLRGLYRGQTATILREFGSYGIWFSAYEGLIRRVMKMENKKRDELPKWQIACCGALVGEVLWVANYPLDVIKSKMQTDYFGEKRQYRNTLDAVQQTWKAYGLKAFFRGLTPTLVRAIPVSAGTFTV
jgi:Mitochondrial carrier protein.